MERSLYLREGVRREARRPAKLEGTNGAKVAVIRDMCLVFEMISKTRGVSKP